MSEHSHNDTEDKVKCQDCNKETPAKKRLCLWCGKRVQHRTHYIWLKRVLNKAVKDNKSELESGKFEEYSDDMFVRTIFHDSEFHIKISAIQLYYNNQYTRDTMETLQDGVVKVKKYMKKPSI